MPSKVRISVPVSVNQVYRDIDTDHLYRVVLTGYSQPDTYLIRVDGMRFDIRTVLTDEFRQMAGANATATGGYELVKDPYAEFLNSEVSTPGHDRKSPENYKLIESLLNRETPKDLRRFIQLLAGGAQRLRICEDLATRKKVQVKTIYKYFRLWLQRGMRQASVASGYPNCGRMIESEDRRRKYTKPPGRKSTVHAPRAMLPSARLDRLLQRIADCVYTNNQAPWDLYLPEDLESKDGAAETRSGGKRSGRKRGKPGWQRGRRSRPSIQTVTDRFNFLLRCKRVVRDETGKAISLDLLDHDAITVHKVRYFLRKRSEWDKKRRTMGDAEYRSHGRPRTGHALQHCRGPGHVFFIDATVADVFLVSCFDRTLVVGRPTIYLVVDAWSRMIVGVHVSFLPPSFAGAALAMRCMVTPKAAFCAQYGFVINDEDWPCCYMPVRFHVDRGCEYIQCRPWEIMSEKFSVGIDNSASYEPFWRGLIERRFGIVTVMAQRYGYAIVESKHDAPRGYDPAIDALWTRAEFTCVLLRAIHEYHRTPISGDFKTPPEMVASGQANTPLNLWRHGVETGLAMLASCDVDEVTHAVLFRGPATITSGALKLKDVGAEYSSGTILRRFAAVHGKARNDMVEVGYNPDELGQISLASANEAPEFAGLSRSNRIDLSHATTTEVLQLLSLNRKNAKETSVANESMRMLQALNSAEVTHRADIEQQVALKLAGQSHPDTKHVKRAKQREANIEQQLGDLAGLHSRSSGDSEPAAERSTDEPSPLARLRRMTGNAASRLLDAVPSKPGRRPRK